MDDRLHRGNLGEELAALWLVDHGFDLLHSNWRAGRYELDIVARKEGVLHIVEVKSRKADGLTAPEDAMTRTKFRALCTAANIYIGQFGIDMDTQFDLIAVDFAADGSHEIRYIPEVMTPHW